MSINKHWSVGDHAELIHRFTEEDIKTFVALSGDDNRLHVDEPWARQSLAGGRVVHGVLTASYISTLIGTRLPGDGALWNRFHVDWRKMVRLGDEIRFRAEVTSIREDIMELAITGHRDQELVLEASARVMLMGQASQGAVGPSNRDDHRSSRQSEALSVSESKKVNHGPRSRPEMISDSGKAEDRVEKRDSLESRNVKGEGYVLVTGATGGLGREVMMGLERENYSMIAWGRDEATLRVLSKTEGLVLAQNVDLEDEDSVKLALGELPNGACRGILHLAAPPWRSVNMGSDELLDEMERHWKVGPKAYAMICRALQDRMIAGTSLVALSTQFAIEAPPENCAAYIGAKMAMEGLTRSMALELGSRGIRANMLSPSMVNTPYVRDLPVRRKMVEAARNPMRRLCEPKDVADALIYLLSDKSAFINGTNLPLTGGLTI